MIFTVRSIYSKLSWNLSLSLLIFTVRSIYSKLSWNLPLSVFDFYSSIYLFKVIMESLSLSLLIFTVRSIYSKLSWNLSLSLSLDFYSSIYLFKVIMESLSLSLLIFTVPSIYSKLSWKALSLPSPLSPFYNSIYLFKKITKIKCLFFLSWLFKKYIFCFIFFFNWLLNRLDITTPFDWAQNTNLLTYLLTGYCIYSQHNNVPLYLDWETSGQTEQNCMIILNAIYF